MKKIFIASVYIFVLASCTQEISSVSSYELLYDRESNITKQQNHYKSIKKIELINVEEPEFIDVLSENQNVVDLEKIDSLVKKYTYDFDVVSYNIGDIFIYKYKNNSIPLRIFSFDDNNEKSITISNINKDELYYRIIIDKNNNLITKIDHFENSPFKKIIKQQENKDPYCDDLPWDDCMDCTVSDCGSEWWCVGLLIVAPGETMGGIAFSCLFDLPNE